MTKGERLRELREKNRFSQVEAAERLGVSKQTLYKYEKDIITNIPSDVIEKMATLYETTPANIMGWIEVELYPEIQAAKHHERLKRYIKSINAAIANKEIEINEEFLSQMLPSKEAKEFWEFYKVFKDTTPSQRQAILSLLKPPKSDS